MTMVGPLSSHHARSSLLGHCLLALPEARHCSTGYSVYFRFFSMAASKALIHISSTRLGSLTHSPPRLRLSHSSVAAWTALPPVAAHDGSSGALSRRPRAYCQEHFCRLLAWLYERCGGSSTSTVLTGS